MQGWSGQHCLRRDTPVAAIHPNRHGHGRSVNGRYLTGAEQIT
jgi:hypothetical protein